MRYQSKKNTCGPSSIANAMKALGIRKSEKAVLKISNTTEQGTDEPDMIRTLTELGCRVTRFEQPTLKKSWHWLCNKLREGSVAILCVNNWNHYVLCFAMLGSDRVVLFDPDKEGPAKKENGLMVLNKRQLKRRWYNLNTRLYSALAVSK